MKTVVDQGMHTYALPKDHESSRRQYERQNRLKQLHQMQDMRNQSFAVLIPPALRGFRELPTILAVVTQNKNYWLRSMPLSLSA